MESTQNIAIKVIFSFSIMCSIATIAHAMHESVSKIKTGIDGRGNLASVWVTNKGDKGQPSIQGFSGMTLPGNVVSLTDPVKYARIQEPKLATSKSQFATTRAVAAWLATDLHTHNGVIQCAILTATGWSTSPIVLSENDGSEKVIHNDYNAVISDDGLTMMITWVSLMSATQDRVVRASNSTNGGLTWSPPQTLSATKKAHGLETVHSTLEILPGTSIESELN